MGYSLHFMGSPLVTPPLTHHNTMGHPSPFMESLSETPTLTHRNAMSHPSPFMGSPIETPWVTLDFGHSGRPGGNLPIEID